MYISKLSKLSGSCLDRQPLPPAADRDSLPGVRQDHLAPAGERPAMPRALLRTLDRADQERPLALEMLRRPGDVGDVDAGAARRGQPLEPGDQLVLPPRLGQRSWGGRALSQQLTRALGRYQQLVAGTEPAIGEHDHARQSRHAPL